MRKLASIQTIDKIEVHPNADALEICTVLGWKVITKIGEFKVGDWCVYCEVDSMLPEEPEFEFMRPRGFRVKTIKLRSYVSQGICFPLDILKGRMCPSGGVAIHTLRPIYDGCCITLDAVFGRLDIEVGDDVTDILNITKYDPPLSAQLDGIAKGNFPGFVFKTDETRLQSIPHIIDDCRDVDMYVSAKIDGSSMTVYYNNTLDDKFGVCSRNTDLLETVGNTMWKVARELDLENILASSGRNLAIQGEIAGEKIQGNKLKLIGHHFFAFQVFDIDTATYFTFDEFMDFCGNNNIKTVPIIDAGFKTLNTVDEYVEYSTKRSVLNPDVWEEGYVFRHKNNCSKSFKVINPNFLLKYEDA